MSATIDIEFLFLTLLISAIKFQLVAPKTTHFLSSKVSFNPKYIQDNRLDINDGGLDVIINIRQTYKQDQWSLMDISIRNSKKDTYRTLLKYDMNVCRLFYKPEGRIISGLLNSFLEQGDMPRSCPIAKGNYSWHLSADKFQVPAFFPNSQYRLMMHAYFRKGSAIDSIGNVTLFVAIQ